MAKGESNDDGAPKRATRKKSDPETLQSLGEAQCSLTEVAAIMGRPPDAVFNTAAEEKAYLKGRAEGLKALRLAQLDMAKKSVSMATMLGRLYLGQAPKREQDESAPIDYADIQKRLRNDVRLIVARRETDGD